LGRAARGCYTHQELDDEAGRADEAHEEGSRSRRTSTIVGDRRRFAREEKRGGTVVVASGDRDTFQLASERCTILYPCAPERWRAAPAAPTPTAPGMKEAAAQAAEKVAKAVPPGKASARYDSENIGRGTPKPGGYRVILWAGVRHRFGRQLRGGGGMNSDPRNFTEFAKPELVHLRYNQHEEQKSARGVL
jgi:hypothetical protein